MLVMLMTMMTIIMELDHEGESPKEAIIITVHKICDNLLKKYGTQSIRPIRDHYL